MTSRHRTTKIIRYTLILIIVCILGLNILLRVIDPLGVVRYWRESHALFALALPHETGYRLTPGVHDIGYRLTVGLDGLRITPDSNLQADCAIAVVGDSVAFGMGVDDNKTLVNILATQHADIRWINAAIAGYSSENVLRQLDNVQANGYIWIIIQNDDELEWHYHYDSSGKLPSALSQYLISFIQQKITTSDNDTFTRFADDIIAHDNLLAIAFENERLTDIVQTRYPDAVIVPLWTHTVSRFDNHPNADGHVQIAESIAVPVSAFVESVCNG